MTELRPDPRFRNLVQLLEATPALQAEPYLTVRLPFTLKGRIGFSTGSLELLNQSNTTIRIMNTTQAQDYILSISQPKTESSTRNPDEIAQAQIQRAFFRGRLFLASLSSASKAFLLWRTLDTYHKVQVDFAEKDRNVSPETSFVNVDGQDYVSEFHLHHALRTVAQMQQQPWSDPFLMNYENGGAFLLAPRFSVNYWPEAFLSFFRCLEYLVMVKILDKKGQFRPPDLGAAMRKLGANISGGPLPKKAVQGFATQLVRRRGQCAAHHLKGHRNDLEAQEIYKLKEMVDFLFAVTVDKKL